MRGKLIGDIKKATIHSPWEREKMVWGTVKGVAMDRVFKDHWKLWSLQRSDHFHLHWSRSDQNHFWNCKKIRSDQKIKINYDVYLFHWNVITKILDFFIIFKGLNSLKTLCPMQTLEVNFSFLYFWHKIWNFLTSNKR